MHIFLGLLGIAFGVLIVTKTEWIIQNFGVSEWAEAKMGTSGGTRMLYKLIGIGIIFFAFLAMTGQLGGVVLNTVGRLFTGGAAF